MESKIQCFRVRVVFIIYTWPNSWFLSHLTFPPIIEYYCSLLFSYNTILSANMPINITFPTPSTSYNEVWDMDNGDYYVLDPSELVCLGDGS